tara:strand:+ start:742 stop:1782 length:1041 start_codon:yes stop_codon:yes gene_type:complete
MSKYYAVRITKGKREVVGSASAELYNSLEHFGQVFVSDVGTAALGITTGSTAGPSSTIELYEIPEGVSVGGSDEFYDNGVKRLSLGDAFSVNGVTHTVGENLSATGSVLSSTLDDETYREKYFQPTGKRKRNHFYDRHSDKSKVLEFRNINSKVRGLKPSNDPRTFTNMSASDAQLIERNVINSAYKDKLSTFKKFTFLRDDNTKTEAIFKSDFSTIKELFAIRNYVDLNKTVIDTDDPSSVSYTKISVLDANGDVYNLSEIEFKRMFYVILESFYQSYLNKVSDLEIILKVPDSYSNAEKLDYLRGRTSTSDGTSRSSSSSSSSSDSSSSSSSSSSSGGGYGGGY